MNNGIIKGCKIDTYLLETIRIVHQNEDERNFHIFYQLCKGETNPEQRRSLGLEGFSCQDFQYLTRTSEFEADGIDDHKGTRVVDIITGRIHL